MPVRRKGTPIVRGSCESANSTNTVVRQDAEHQKYVDALVASSIHLQVQWTK